MEHDQRNWDEELQEAEKEAEDSLISLQQAQQREQAARVRVEALRKIVSGMADLRQLGVIVGQGQFPEVAEMTASATTRRGSVVLEDGQPRGQEAVRRIMASDLRIWRVPELTREIEKRGWIDPLAQHKKAAVSNSVGRLHAAGEIERVGYGEYRYKLPGATAPEEAAAAASDNTEEAEGRED